MSKKKITQTSLPLSRTTKIMNSAVGVESVDQDIVALATKATELFLMDFAKRAYANSDSNVLEYEDIQRLVHSDDRYDFLVDTTPKRIKFGEALKRIKQSQHSRPESDSHDTSSPKPRTSSVSPDRPAPHHQSDSDRPLSQTRSAPSECSEAPSSNPDPNIEND